MCSRSVAAGSCCGRRIFGFMNLPRRRVVYGPRAPSRPRRPRPAFGRLAFYIMTTIILLIITATIVHATIQFSPPLYLPAPGGVVAAAMSDGLSSL